MTTILTPGIRYIVTKASRNREFQVGDQIRLEADGSISNFHAQGWMPPEDVPEATRGMEAAPEQSEPTEADRLRAICVAAHDRLLRGDTDAELLALLESAWKPAPTPAPPAAHAG